MGIPVKTYVAGHRGLVGSALVRRFQTDANRTLVMRTHAELDLTDSQAVDRFFAAERPDEVLLAAAKVGGIMANQDFPVDFMLNNLQTGNKNLSAGRLRCYALLVNLFNWSLFRPMPGSASSLAWIWPFDCRPFHTVRGWIVQRIILLWLWPFGRHLGSLTGPLSSSDCL